MFQPIELRAGFELIPHRKRSDEPPATSVGKEYCTSCHELSEMAPDETQTFNQLMPSAEA